MDTIEATKTLANLKRYISGGGVVDRKASEAIDMAIRALEVTEDPDTISRQANGWHGEARIKFCPMCGRRLADD